MKDIIKDRIEKIENNIVPQGYKKTEIGIIPEDWKVEKLGEVSSIYRGASPRPISDSKWFDKESEIGWVRISDVSKANKYLMDTEEYLSTQGIEKSRLVKKNNLIMSICATVGKPIITGINVCIHDGFVVFKDPKINISFLYEILKKIEGGWVKYGQTGSQMNLNVDIVSFEKIPIPLLKEQEKIASILSIWDQYIENIDSIIESKKKQKKELMQNLLTGEVRLPGFNGEWKEVKLGDVIKEVNKKTTKNNEYEILSVTKDGIIPQNKYFTKQIASKNNKGYKIVKEGNLVFSTMNLWMGSLDILKGIEIGIVSPAYKVFKIDIENFDILFLNDFMKTNRMIYLYNINSEQGASVVRRNLDLDSLLSSRINLPPLDEQVAIASVLSSADREIELLEDLRNKRMEEKKGLMQLLLTGIVRVGG